MKRQKGFASKVRYIFYVFFFIYLYLSCFDLLLGFCAVIIISFLLFFLHTLESIESLLIVLIGCETQLIWSVSAAFQSEVLGEEKVGSIAFHGFQSGSCDPWMMVVGFQRKRVAGFQIKDNHLVISRLHLWYHD